MNATEPGLPQEPVDRLTRALAYFLRIKAASGAVLLICALVALALSNSPWADPYEQFWHLRIGIEVGDLVYARSLRHWINDALMALFFFVVALEVKRELAIGELQHPRIAAFPAAAAIGGMLVPAGLFVAIEGGGAGAQGWGTVMATDTAFMIGCLALLGRHVPQSLRLFLVSAAIFDDIGAVLVVAVGYGSGLAWPALIVIAALLALIRTLARSGVRQMAVYVVCGVALWIAVDASGLHATAAGVLLGLMTPARSWVDDRRLRATFHRVLA